MEPMRSFIIISNKTRLDGWHGTGVYQEVTMMLLRMNLRVALSLLCVGVMLFTLFWSQCGDLTRHRPGSIISNALSERNLPYYNDEIKCVINGEYNIICKRDVDDVYVPFSFIHKYFEVYGKMSVDKGIEQFDWSHSYSKVYHPKKKYDPYGTFTTFENYNVEVRERVKCISGTEGVPVSIQWEPRGFYYPTQIAQFGLAHYSKNITEAPPRRKVIYDGEKVIDGWIVSQDASMIREFDSIKQSNVMRFFTSDQMLSQVWIKLNMTMDFVLSVDVQLKANSSLTVVLQNIKDKKETIYLHYLCSNNLIATVDEHIYYGVGTQHNWKHLTRDLLIDIQKGLALLNKHKRKLNRNKYKISSVILTGSGSLDNLTVASSEHMDHFFAAAEWLVNNAHVHSGGWPIPVRRKIAAGVTDLKPGWFSAMSQGHAISLLSRAYHRSGDVKYLQAAKKALYVLDVPAENGGVRAMWLDKYVWYEEYPTKPSLFVLNGFIYTLLGLYDLHVIEDEHSISLAKKMFDDGMTSLKSLLPLFDTGSGSFYDLRHFTLGVSPNIARWDYHATHVNQLYLLASLDDDPILINTAKRWESYMQGKRAAHN